MKLTQLKTATKLWLTASLITALLLALIGVSASRSAMVQAEADRVGQDSLQRIETATRWMGLTQANAARTLAISVSSEPAIETAFKDAIAATSAQISELQKAIVAVATSPEEVAQLEKIGASRKAMLALRAQAQQLKGAGKLDEAAALVKGPYGEAVGVYLNDLSTFVQLQHKLMERRQARIGEARGVTVAIVGVCVALIIAAILGGAYMLVRGTMRPLREANAIAARIAAGDLAARVDVARGDEYGDLLKSLMTMSRALEGMIEKVRLSTGNIAAASSEIAAGNSDLSRRTEQTSIDLQQSANAIGALTGSVQQSARNAQQASELAQSASQVAQRGGAAVHDVVTTMAGIDASSRRIAEIIGVIDGIAFQTNILALNAAVEAARAGEQGRGFAVVAGEVRSLARRSAEAAREIKDLIHESVERVAAGTRLVSDAGHTMDEIVVSVQRVTDMINDITTLIAEQSAAIADVNRSVASLDEMTQENSALVEQSAAAAQSLRDQADQLAEAVGVFHTGAGSAIAPAPVPAPARPLRAPQARRLAN